MKRIKNCKLREKIILKEFNGHGSITSIHKRHGIARHIIRRILRQYGLLKSEGFNKWNAGSWQTKISEDEIIKLGKQGWQIKPIARKYHIDPSIIRNIFIENNIKLINGPHSINNYLFGKHHLEITKKRMSKSHKGKPQPWRVGQWTGPKNPRWTGGEYIEYPWEFDLIRPKILERDKYKCVVCHTNNDLIVHHVDKNKKNNVESNLVTLCRPCHARVHITINKKHEVKLLKILKRSKIL